MLSSLSRFIFSYNRWWSFKLSPPLLANLFILSQELTASRIKKVWCGRRNARYWLDDKKSLKEAGATFQIKVRTMKIQSFGRHLKSSCHVFSNNSKKRKVRYSTFDRSISLFIVVTCKNILEGKRARTLQTFMESIRYVGKIHIFG